MFKVGDEVLVDGSKGWTITRMSPETVDVTYKDGKGFPIRSSDARARITYDPIQLFLSKVKHVC